MSILSWWEARTARQRMAQDLRDPRRAFVWGVIAIKNEIDIAYRPSVATTAVTEWYGKKSGQDIVDTTPQRLMANAHVAYNQFRLCFLARAGYGAGMLDEAASWNLAIRHAAVLQHHYADWSSYGRGYWEGHLLYRGEKGDSAAVIAEIRAAAPAQLADKQRTVWASIPWATPLG